MTKVTAIDPNPETEVVGTISGYAEPPVKLEIATKPMASTHSLVDVWGNGVKWVGFIQCGGTVAQFDNSVRLMRIKNKRNGNRNGTFIHATAGTVVDHYEDYQS